MKHVVCKVKFLFSNIKCFHFICTHIVPASTVKRVVCKISHCFLHIHSTVVNDSNFERNQAFGSPVVHELNISNSSLFILHVCVVKYVSRKVSLYFPQSRVLVSMFLMLYIILFSVSRKFFVMLSLSRPLALERMHQDTSVSSFLQIFFSNISYFAFSVQFNFNYG